MQERNKRLEHYYHDDEYVKNKYEDSDEFDYSYYEILKEFRGVHPKTMLERVGNSKRLRPRKNRWLNWRFYKEILAHGFKG